MTLPPQDPDHNNFEHLGESLGLLGDLEAEPYDPRYPCEYFDIQPGFSSFITRFYRVSDMPDKDGEWVDFFMGNATVTVGSASASGTDEIRQLRRGMWEEVETRKHTLDRIFLGTFENEEYITFQNEDAPDLSTEVMLTGRVEYQLKNGEKRGADWAGHGSLVYIGEDMPVEGMLLPLTEEEAAAAELGPEAEQWSLWKFKSYKVYFQHDEGGPAASFQSESVNISSV